MRKRIVTTLVAVATVAALSGGAFARGAPAGPAGQQGQGAVFGRLVQELGLSDAQKEQLQPMLASFREQRQERRQAQEAQFRVILTPEQQAILDKAKGDRGPAQRPGALKQLGLTEDQLARAKSLREQARSQFQADFEQMLAQMKTVLTPDQQARLQELIQQRKERMGQPGGPRGGRGPQGPLEVGPKRSRL